MWNTETPQVIFQNEDGLQTLHSGLLLLFILLASLGLKGLAGTPPEVYMQGVHPLVELFDHTPWGSG